MLFSLFLLFCLVWVDEKERKKDDINVATNINYGVAFSSSWSESLCYPETNVTKIRRPSRIIVSF